MPSTCEMKESFVFTWAHPMCLYDKLPRVRTCETSKEVTSVRTSVARGLHTGVYGLQCCRPTLLSTEELAACSRIHTIATVEMKTNQSPPFNFHRVCTGLQRTHRSSHLRLITFLTHSCNLREAYVF